MILCGFGMIVCPLQLSAEKRQLICRALTEQDGLSDNRVTCFFKDRSGFMWIGTENGLNRFDGHSFVVYRPGQERFNLSNEFVTGIGQDESGRLWVATKNGLNLLDIENDSLTVFLPEPSATEGNLKGLANNLLWGLYADRHKVWLAIDNRDFGYYDTRSGEFVYFPWKKFVGRVFPQHSGEYCAVQSVRPGYPSGLWLGTTMGLFGLDTLSGRFEFLGGEQRSDVELFYTGKDTSGRPLAVFRQEFSQTGVWEPETGYTVPGDPVPGRLFRGSWAGLNFWLNVGDDLFRYDSQAGRLAAVELVASDELSSPKIKAGFEDAGQRCYWLATDRGCYIYSDYLNMFPFTPVPPGNGSRSVEIRNALDTGDGTVWFADVNGRLFIRGKDGEPLFIREINGYPLTECVFLFSDSANNTWILTRNHLFCYRKATGTFARVEVPFPGEKVYTVMREDDSGNLWLGTINSGVYIWRKQDNRWEKWQDPTQPVPLYVRDILLDKNGEYAWFATVNLGLARYHIPSGRTDYYSKDNIPANGLQSANITSLAQASGGAVWIGTEWGGLSRYDGEPGGRARFTTFTTAHGLPENTIYGILPGSGDGLWVSSARGLVYFDGVGKVTHQWLSGDHQVIKPVRALLHPDRGAGFILPVEQGSVTVRWPEHAGDSIRYPLVMKGIYINDTLSRYPLPGLPHHKNQVRFVFQLLRYDSPSGIFYEYRLEGYEKAWKKSAGILADITYFALPPGDFIFRVRATDALGNLLSGESRYTFTIAKPLWMRWELWAVAIWVIGAGGYLLWRRQERRIRDEKIVNYFATSLYGRNTVEDVFWDIAKNCISQLGFEDCVLYLYDENRGVLVQKAAFGPKNPEKHEILNPIVIPVGEGITGYAALHGKYVLVPDTTKDPRYIVDDQQRQSELAIPIFVDGKVFGVIDTEHSRKNFYNRRHVRILQKIAGLCNQKLTGYLAEEKLRAAIARDLHDEIGSTLTSISIISKIAIEQQNHEKVYDYLGRIKENSRVMMDAMSDMVWAINPENDSLQRMIIRLKEFASEILEPVGIAYSFDTDETLLDTRLNLSSRKDLYLILKEAITNAAKYSRAGSVSITFRNLGDSVRISVEDDGAGMDTREAARGNGLKNMKHRALVIEAALTIRSEKGRGTAITIKVPVT